MNDLMEYMFEEALHTDALACYEPKHVAQFS